MLKCIMGVVVNLSNTNLNTDKLGPLTFERNNQMCCAAAEMLISDVASNLMLAGHICLVERERQHLIGCIQIV